MNIRRLRKLTRDLDRISKEIAKELASAEDAAVEKTGTNRRKPRPLTELDMQKARNTLRRLGIAV